MSRLCMIMSAALCSASAAGQPFAVESYTIDSGGGISAGGSFVLHGTIGQHDAGPESASGGLAVRGGFWVGSAAPGCNAADVAEPFGLLDLADVTAFVTAFNSGDPLADIAAPFGLLDLADVSLFVASFVGGCP